MLSFSRKRESKNGSRIAFVAIATHRFRDDKIYHRILDFWNVAESTRMRERKDR